MDYNKMAIELHKKHQGKISVCSKVKVEDSVDLSVAYTPGVAEPCREIASDENKVYDYTSKGNLVAVVRDCSAGAWRYRSQGFHSSNGGKINTF